MAAENLNMEELTDERRKAIEQSIRPITDAQLKTLGEEMFPYVDHPWRATYFNFLAENAGSIFHHASTRDGVHFIYCRDKDQGMWFLPGSGRGPLQEKGRAIMKAIVDARR